MRWLVIIVFALISVSTTSAQAPACPQVAVHGPAGTVVPGDNLTYTVSIHPAERAVGLSYLWTVVTMNGPVGMVRGQGTTQIEVPFSHANVTATVKVLGLPEGCPNSVDETAGVEELRQAEKLYTIVGSVSKADRAVFVRVIQTLNADPTSGIYIAISGGKGGSIKSKRSAIEKSLSQISKDSLKRITFVHSAKTDDTTAIWHVPAGSERPF